MAVETDTFNGRQVADQTGTRRQAERGPADLATAFVKDIEIDQPGKGICTLHVDAAPLHTGRILVQGDEGVRPQQITAPGKHPGVGKHTEKTVQRPGKERLCTRRVLLRTRKVEREKDGGRIPSLQVHLQVFLTPVPCNDDAIP
jgi:hypothetical protein